MVMKSKLERWIQYGDCIVGYIFDSKHFPPGTRVKTDPIRFVDLPNLEVECLDGKYKLGEPGTAQEHQQPLLGQIQDLNYRAPAQDKKIIIGV